MRPDCFAKHPWLFLFGAGLAVGAACLAIFRPGPVVLYLAPLPMTYAAALAGSCFWFRAKAAADRERTFWRLWAGGCWLWILAGMIGLSSLPRSPHPNGDFFGLTFTFLPQVLFMAALVMQPEISGGQLRNPVVRYEAALVALWWIYLYALTIVPWDWVLPNAHEYRLAFALLHHFQNVTIVLWLAALWLATKGPWRRVYGHWTGAFLLLALSTIFFYRSWHGHRLASAMIFQALLTGAFLWLARGALISTAPNPAAEAAPKPAPTLGAGAWLASITAIGIPLLATWSSFFSGAPPPIQRFRLLVSFGTLVAAALLLYRWQDVAEAQRDRLVEDLESSVRELRRLQGHFAEAEKLASLGQLAAGAAHEINNPVAAMLGYSELLRSDPSASNRAHEFGRKIGDQARRIRSLVENLLSLAKPEGREAEIVDVSTPLRGALELRRISAGHRKQNVPLVAGEDSFLVQGDREKLLQVFYRLLLALSEDDGETSVEVRLSNESNRGRVIVEFIGKPDISSAPPSAPAIYNAHRAQQGKELSLRLCYTIVEEHGGTIVHESPLEGGRIFRVELPAAGASQPATSALS